MNLPALVRLARPHQWTKNLLVFAGLLFTGSYRDPNAWRVSLIAFGAMCLASSATYVINDVMDRDRDRANPIKATRPIASGLVSIRGAMVWSLILLAGALSCSLLLNDVAKWMLATYLLLQVFYNFGGKSVPVLDVFLVGSGFVIRAAIGAAAMAVEISGWLLLCTGSLALLLSFGKRRAEFHTLGEDRNQARPSLDGYTSTALDALLIVSACSSALCYGLYAIESETARNHPGLVFTVVFVVYGIMRYLLISFGQMRRSAEPEVLLVQDRQILGTVALFVVTAALAMLDLLPALVEVSN